MKNKNVLHLTYSMGHISYMQCKGLPSDDLMLRVVKGRDLNGSRNPRYPVSKDAQVRTLLKSFNFLPFFFWHLVTRRQTERNLFFAFLSCHLFAGPRISILIPTPLNAQKHTIWFSEHPQQLSEHPSPPYAACTRQLVHPLSLKTALPVNRPLPESTPLEKHSSGTCTTRS